LAIGSGDSFAYDPVQGAVSDRDFTWLHCLTPFQRYKQQICKGKPRLGPEDQPIGASST